MSLTEDLAAGLMALHVEMRPERENTLLSYLALLDKWNKIYNLTAIREPGKMLSQHLLDSLSVYPYVAGTNILDVGSGGGFPGIPLAIAFPEKSFVLLDSSQKKTTFLRQASIELKLTNVSVVCDRVEIWRPAHLFDIIISRAFSDLATFARLAGRLCAPNGAMLAMKGRHPNEEEAQIPGNVMIDRVIPLHVPQLEAQRHLVIMKVK